MHPSYPYTDTHPHAIARTLFSHPSSLPARTFYVPTHLNPLKPSTNIPLGLQYPRTITSAVFYYLETLRNMDEGALAAANQEFINILLPSVIYRSAPDPTDYSSALASAMHYYEDDQLFDATSGVPGVGRCWWQGNVLLLVHSPNRSAVL